MSLTQLTVPSVKVKLMSTWRSMLETSSMHGTPWGITASKWISTLPFWSTSKSCWEITSKNEESQKECLSLITSQAVPNRWTFSTMPRTWFLKRQSSATSHGAQLTQVFTSLVTTNMTLSRKTPDSYRDKNLPKRSWYQTRSNRRHIRTTKKT